MSSVKKNLKSILPRPIWNLGSGAYWGWHNRGRHVLGLRTDPRWRRSLQELETYRNRHHGQRCFLIGNGPSLRQMDLSPLRNEFTIGLNRIYLLYPELGFTTTYLVLVKELVLEQCAADIQALPLPKFITWRARRWFQEDKRLTFLDTDYTGPENFSGEATRRLFEGFTVTYVSLQLAFFMGFQEVILIGVDHNYVTQGTPNTTVTSSGDDPNHFTPGYFGAGFKWQLPDLECNERAYRMAREAYAQAGRQVFDATVGGKLTVFPKRDYRELVRIE